MPVDLNRSTSVVVCVLTLWLAPEAGAQDHVADALAFLVTSQSVNTGSEARDAAAADATSRTISSALLANLAALPITSTAGAFSYQLNPALGTVERSTQSFGPVFADRAVTLGAGTATIGLSFQHLRFTALDGRNLRGGTLVTTANQFVDEPEAFDVDRLTLGIDADVATLYGSVGLTDRVDVAVAAPLVSLRLNGARVNAYRGRQFTQATARATALGVADLLVRSKVRLLTYEGMNLAGAVDVRLPTGSREDLLGTGRTAVRMSAVGSAEGPRTSAHASIGLAFGGLATEFTYSGAVATAASPRLTLTAEALGRWADLPGDIVQVEQPHPLLAGVNTIRLLPGSSRLQTLTLAPGLKWNVTGTWILVANVGIPMLKGGLRAPVMPMVALEYALGR